MTKSNDVRLDELREIPAHEVGNLMFNLISGDGAVGKSSAQKLAAGLYPGPASGQGGAPADATHRLKHWQTFLTVNGEATLGDLLKSDGRSA